MAWPQDELPLAIEMWTGAAWEDISADVRAAEGAQVVVTRGQPDESSAPEPGSITATLANADGRYSPRNPLSDLYGKIGRNTPLRVRVTESHVAVGDQVRGVGEVSEWPPRWDVSGQDVTTSIVAQGILRRLGQGNSPLLSPLKSGILNSPAAEFVVDYWPMEDGAGATSFASGIPGRSPLSISGEMPDLAGIGPLLGSDKIPVLASTTTFSAQVGTYTDVAPQDFGIRVICDIPLSPSWSDNTPILWLYQENTAGVDRYEVRYKSATGFLGIRALDSAGTAISGETISSVDIRGRQIYLGMELLASGANTSVNGFYDYDDGTGALTEHSWGTGAIATSVLTRATKVTIAPVGGLDELAIGQLVVTTGFGQFDSGWFSGSRVTDGLISYRGEPSGRRAARILDERGVPFTGVYVGDEDETESMGAQAIPAALLNVFNETWAADAAVVYETRNDLGISWRSRRSLYNQPIALQLDHDADGEIAPDLQPTDDDQRVRNRVTVTRKSGDTTGSSATYEDSTSRMGTQAPPDGVGVYEDSLDLNLETDDDLIHHAAWPVHVGTWDEARYPVVRINLTALAQQGKTDLVAQAAALDVGDRLRLVNLPIWTGADGGTVDLMCLGFTETFDYPNGWIIEINTVPYGPYQVGALAADSPSTADANVQRATGDPDCVIRTDLTTSTTSVPFDPNFMRWTTDANHFNTSKYPAMQVAVGGERMTVSAISTTAATYVAIGAASHANNTTVSPALYTGHTAGDWICVLAGVTGGAGTLSITAGYELLASPGGLYFWVKRHGSSESNPTITPSGTSSGNMISAQVFGLRNMPIFPAWIDSSVGSNASAQNIAYSGISAGVYPGRVMLILGRKTDQWTSVAVPSGFTEISEAATGTGNKQGLYAAYRIDTTPARVDPGALAVTGGTTAVSDVAVLALPGGFQTATVTRSANGVSKAHSAGDSMALYMPLIQAL